MAALGSTPYQQAAPFSARLSAVGEEKLREVESCFVYGDFRRALWISYEHLKTIATPMHAPVVSEAEGAGGREQLLLLQHRCTDTSVCDCEQFLSLTAQFLFKLKYDVNFIDAFLRTFYASEPRLPLLVVGLLAGLAVNQAKLSEAQEVVEQCFAAEIEAEAQADVSKAGVGLTAWPQAKRNQYMHLVSTLVTHILLPQGMVDEARSVLSHASHHPRAVLPIDPTLVHNLMQSIEQHVEQMRFSNDQFAQLQCAEELEETARTQDRRTEERKAAKKQAGMPSTVVRARERQGWRQWWDRAVATAKRHKKKLAAGLLVGVLLLLLRSLYVRRKRTIYPAWRTFWHEVMELLDGAFSVNFGVSRMQRRQRRQQILRDQRPPVSQAVEAIADMAE